MWPAWCRWRWAVTTGWWTAPWELSGSQSSASSWRSPSPCCSDRTVKAAATGRALSPERSDWFRARLGPFRDWPAFQSGHSQLILVEKRQNSLRFPVCLAVSPARLSVSFLILTHPLFIKRPQNNERPELGFISHRIASGHCRLNIEQFTKGNVTSQQEELNRKRVCILFFFFSTHDSAVLSESRNGTKKCNCWLILVCLKARMFQH